MQDIPTQGAFSTHTKMQKACLRLPSSPTTGQHILMDLVRSANAGGTTVS
jgi:hypothetical protein